MSDGHCFISYSHADGLDFVIKLVTELEGGYPSIRCWFEKRDIHSDKDDWDDQLAKAIQQCRCLVYVMSADSTAGNSNCKDEWTWALKYKKPVICLWVDSGAQDQFRLNNRQKIDFIADFGAGLGKLRKAIAHIVSPEGQLQELNHRLADANRDLRRASETDRPRIQAEIDDLKRQIEIQQKFVDNPKAAEAQTQKNIEAGLEQERKPEKPTTAQTSTKFINPPPGIAPNYFQNRLIETKQIVDFLNDDAQRLMTIIGRGGVGKTAMVCRLLKGLEGGELPDGLGKMRVDGIVYLSESGSHRVNFANIFYDLCKLLPAESANELDAVYKNPQGSTESKMRAVLEKFTGGRVVLLLDNFEPLVDTETFAIRDAELDEALRAFLNGTHTAVNIVITTRVAPKPLNLTQPGRQRGLTLDEGLESPYAENILREMDSDGRLGLKLATDALLRQARDKTRGFPRALEALFAILASDRYTTLEELLVLPLPENVVEALVGEAFNRLDTNAQKVMQALAVYNRPVTPAAVDYLLAPHIPAIDSAPILQRLANMHFARKESGRFYLHPVDREFAFSLIPEKDLTTKNTKVTKEEPKSLVQSLFGKRQPPIPNYHLLFITTHDLTSRAADYFAQARKPRAEWKKLDDLSAQLAEFDLRCAAGDYDTAVKILRDEQINDYLFLWGHARLAVELQEGIQEKVVNDELRMFLLISLGRSYYSVSQVRKTIACYEDAREIAVQLKNLSYEMIILELLGGAHRLFGETHKATNFYEQALLISREIGNREDEASILSSIGDSYVGLGEAQKAIGFIEQALTINREIGNHNHEIDNLNGLGLSYAKLGKVRKAIKFYEQALSIQRENRDRAGEAISLANLGTAYLYLQDIPKGIDLYDQALYIQREIGNRLGESVYLCNLGYAYSDLGEIRKAIEFFERSLSISREIGIRVSESANLNGLGNAYSNLGDVNKAVEFYERALFINREMEFQGGKAVSLINLGLAYTDLGDLHKAIKFYEQALLINREIGNQEGQSADLSRMGNTYLFLGQFQKAEENIKQALSIADGILLVPQQKYSHYLLAQSYLLQNSLSSACTTIEAAMGYDVPNNNHNASALHGIIALRQGDASAARGAFVRAIGQADEILSKTAEFYSALDAKGLALSGLLIGNWGLEIGVRERDELRDKAIATFKRARQIAPHAGVVRSVLRLFDELTQCDPDGLLKDVRPAAAGEA